jgi:phenylpyruvate tautomerase PptA (4-oxalocrotonate tautomerase family)
MPILEVEIVTRPQETLPPNLAGELANRAGEVFGAPPGSTWVKLRVIPSEYYAENGGAAEGVYPVFVSVLKARLPEPDALQNEVDQLTALIAQVCARPPVNVHILYQPAAAGRIAFGGIVVKAD